MHRHDPAARTRPADERLEFVGGDDRAEPDLAEQPDAGRRHLVEVMLAQPGLEQERTSVELGSAWAEVVRALPGGDRDRLRARPGPLPTRPVGLAGRDESRHPAMEMARDPADRPLPWRVVAEHRMRVGVDQSRGDCRPVDVDRGQLAVGADLVDRPERRDHAVADEYGVAVGARLLELAREHEPGAVDKEVGAHDQAAMTSSTVITSPKWVSMS